MDGYRTDIKEIAGWLAESSKVVFFGGAGVSTESGIPDFRSAAGLYAKRQPGGRSPEYLLSHDCLADSPEDFYSFHRSELVHPEARPNPAHLCLARLEQAGIVSAIVTQNIDGLHQMAGSRNVYELHGSVNRYFCVGPANHRFTLEQIPDEPNVPICPQCGAMIRPDVVLYGEGLDMGVIEASVDAIGHADAIIVGGTSLNVYPAAGLLQYYQGQRLALINLDETPLDYQAEIVIHRSIAEVLTDICAILTI